MARRFVTDRDHGYRELINAVAKGRDGATVKVGVQGAQAVAPKEGETGETAKEVTVVDVATWMEFGTDTVPERSFIRAWVDEHNAEIRRQLELLAEEVIKGRIEFMQALDQFGLWAVGKMQERIANGIDPPLSAATIARKGSSKPLINTGQLRSSITHLAERGLAALVSGGA